MEFVRKNLFLIVVVAVVLIAGGVMLALTFNVGGDNDRTVRLRADASNSLRNLSREQISAKKVEAEKRRVETVKAAASDVTRQCIDWSRKNYPVMTVSVRAADGLKTIPAFPINQDLYNANNLKYEVTKKYREVLLETLKQVDPTSVPSEAEIAAEAASQEKQIRERLEAEKRRRAAAGEPKPAQEPTDADIAAEAKKEASALLQERKAREGKIYANEGAMDVIFPNPDSLAPYSEIWKAQLNLWVTGDILAAIAATNEEAMAGLKEQNVTTAAIKRLVKIEVDENYVIGKAASVPGAVGIAGPDGAAAPVPTGAGAPSIDNLTRRICTTQYDVLHYKFIMVLRMRYALSLQRYLAARNYHTVLDVSFNRVAQTPDDPYYYGPDPVVEMTVKGELLLLTAWERGTWETDKWSDEFPPLMPNESVLVKQFDKLRSALRPEDLERMKKPGE